MSLWVAHTGGSLVREKYALEHSCVVTVWEELTDPGLTKSLEDLKELMRNCYIRADEGAIESWARQLRRFIHEMQIGDIIVMPRPEKKMYAVGRVKGEYVYNQDGPHECNHIRTVEWLTINLRRDEIEDDMYYSFKAHISFYQVTRNNIEERLTSKLSI